MIIKIIVIATIIVVGAAFFVPWSPNILSNPFSITDSFNLDINGIHGEAVQTVEGTIDGTVNAVDKGFNNLKEKSKDMLNQIP